MRKLDHGFGRGIDLSEEHSTSIEVEIPEPLAAKVAQAAQSQGKSPTDVVLEAVANRLDPFPRLDDLRVPIRERMKRLGESEDGAVEYFEQVKRELRRERRAAGK